MTPRPMQMHAPIFNKARTNVSETAFIIKFQWYIVLLKVMVIFSSPSFLVTNPDSCNMV